MHLRYFSRGIIRPSRFLSYLLPLFFLTGCGVPSFLVTPVANSNKLKEELVQPGQGFFPKKVAVIEVEGLLLNARSGGFLQPTENDVSLFVQQMEKAEKDPDVRAVVLRVNSPGGTVSASDAMYATVLRFREKTGKPIVASTQDLAASGAYYVSCAADKIVAQPTSLVGSIGVIFNTFDISGTLAKIGARSEAIKSGPLKDLASPFKPLSDPERQVMQSLVNEFYQRFKDIVKTRRNLDDATLAAVSDGRVFSGLQAVQLGLADQAGQLPEAITLAKQLANVPNAKVVLYKRPYGYSGSIYAQGQSPHPQAVNVIQLNLLPSTALLPSGFYYLWEPQ
ncbi:MAG TPA: signal peptide peptidase SppA [Tepidisphaeraceae bacterium]|nr:signal peptide peptidase SppA [Tepidisphaeraceae bacterium]